jgi:hypothetical protein
MRGDGVRVAVPPRKEVGSPEFLSPTRFQILSIGADGLPGTADDIVACGEARRY